MILSFGLLGPGKGFEHAIQAMSLVRERMPDAYYLIWARPIRTCSVVRERPIETTFGPRSTGSGWRTRSGSTIDS